MWNKEIRKINFALDCCSAVYRQATLVFVPPCEVLFCLQVFHLSWVTSCTSFPKRSFVSCFFFGNKETVYFILFTLIYKKNRRWKLNYQRKESGFCFWPAVDTGGEETLSSLRLLNLEICSDSVQPRSTDGRTNIFPDNCLPVTWQASRRMVRLIEIIYSRTCCPSLSAKIVRVRYYLPSASSPTAARRAVALCPGVPSSPLLYLIHNSAVAVDTVINARRHRQAAYARPTQRTKSVQQTAEGCENRRTQHRPARPAQTPWGATFYWGRGGKCSGLDLLSNQTLKREREIQGTFLKWLKCLCGNGSTIYTWGTRVLQSRASGKKASSVSRIVDGNCP